MTFKEKLVILRKGKSLTQDEFASAVGVTRQAVYKWECGQSYPEVPKLLEMKLLFGISIDNLLDDSYDIPLPEKKKKRISKSTKAKIEASVESAHTSRDTSAALMSEVAKVADAAPVAAPKAEPVAAPAPKAEAAPAPKAEVAPAPKAEAAPAPKAEPVAAPAPVVEEAPAPVAEPVVEEAPAPEAPKAEAAPAPAIEAAPAVEETKKRGLFSRLFGGKK